MGPRERRAGEMAHTVPACRARKQRGASRGQTSARVGAPRRVLGRCGVDETGEMLTCERGGNADTPMACIHLPPHIQPCLSSHIDECLFGSGGKRGGRTARVGISGARDRVEGVAVRQSPRCLIGVVPSKNQLIMCLKIYGLRANDSRLYRISVARVRRTSEDGGYRKSQRAANYASSASDLRISRASW